MLYCLGGILLITVILAFEMIPELNELFKLVKFPNDDLKFRIIGIILADIGLCFGVERLLRKICHFNRE